MYRCFAIAQAGTKFAGGWTKPGRSRPKAIDNPPAGRRSGVGFSSMRDGSGMPMMNLSDRVVLVTGGSRGIGAGIVRVLLATGEARYSTGSTIDVSGASHIH